MTKQIPGRQSVAAGGYEYGNRLSHSAALRSGRGQANRPRGVDQERLFLPDTASKERPIEGTLLAVGEGRLDDNGRRVPMYVKAGDKVLFAKYGGSMLEQGVAAPVKITRSAVQKPFRSPACCWPPRR
jgi:co-chaperonin GroES (HSP10)